MDRGSASWDKNACDSHVRRRADELDPASHAGGGDNKAHPRRGLRGRDQLRSAGLSFCDESKIILARVFAESNLMITVNASREKIWVKRKLTRRARKNKSRNSEQVVALRVWDVSKYDVDSFKKNRSPLRTNVALLNGLKQTKIDFKCKKRRRDSTSPG
mmetsp:Transcript_26721/g.64765  ORF Transcript_26721/g.64765 Transcript_26721/m.64765 type:complete len:159 (+) Transcript_26721:242-718(+)